MIKIYGIYDVEEAVYILKIGKTRVKCEFAKGVVDGSRKYPARLQTSNGIAQLAIENSPLFNSRIFLLESIPQPSDVNIRDNGKKQGKDIMPAEEKTPPQAADTAVAKDGPSPAAESEAEIELHEGAESEASGRAEEGVYGSSYDSVRTVADAVVILKNLGGPAKKLRNRDMVLAAAKEIRVTFPNLPE